MKETRSTKEQEIPNWERLEKVLGSFYTDLQRFKDVPSQSSYRLGESVYDVVQLGIEKTEFGYLSRFVLDRSTGSPLNPFLITIRLKPDFSEAVISSSGWRFHERSDGLLYSFVGVKEGRVSRVVQVVHPNGYFDIGDPGTNRRLAQIFQCELSYDENKPTMLNLLLGYEEGGKAQLSYIKEGKEEVDTEPIQVGGRKFSTPTMEQVVEALENTRKNQKAIILKEIFGALEGEGAEF